MMTGRPLGSDSFVKRLEGMLVRKLDPKRTRKVVAPTFAKYDRVRCCVSDQEAVQCLVTTASAATDYLRLALFGGP